jgi:hypothetical protein
MNCGPLCTTSAPGWAILEYSLLLARHGHLASMTSSAFFDSYHGDQNDLTGLKWAILGKSIQGHHAGWLHASMSHLPVRDTFRVMNV